MRDSRAKHHEDTATPGGDPTTLRVAETRVPESAPTFVGPWQATLRHPFLVLVVLLAFVGGAVAIALTREPEYTAESRVNVGRINVPAYTLQGVIIGNQSLAQSYSRAIGAPDVVNAAARAAHVSPTTAVSNLTATPVPQSTVIRIKATSGSERAAVRLANGASRGLRAYVIRLNRNAQATGVLADYQRALRAAASARKRVDTATTDRARERATFKLQAAELKAKTLGQQYQVQAGAEAPPNLVQALAPAVSATSDFDSRLQELLLIAAVAGLCVGIALALLRSNLELLRSRS
jgi:capsular polysaccharide biosynthesis protein